VTRHTRAQKVADPCPDKVKHTPCPEDYLGWHNWAEQMHKTHYQARCPGCGLHAIWLPQDALVEQLLAAIRLDENAASREARGWETGSRYEGQPINWVTHVRRWPVDRVRALSEAHRAVVEHCVAAIEGWRAKETPEADAAIAELRAVLQFIADAYQLELAIGGDA